MGKQRQALGRGLSALIPGADAGEAEAGAPSDDRILSVPVDAVEPNPHQPRTAFAEESVDELAASIREKGLIQPVSVRRYGKGYQLVAGERRLRAARKAGLKSIPAIVLDVTTDQEMMELSLIENIQRENLNPVEEARAFRSLMDECFLTQEEVAARVGKDRSSIANTLRLLALPEPVRKSLEEGRIGMGHARALLGLDDDRAQVALCRQIEAEGLSVRRVEALVRGAQEGKGPPRGRKPSRRDPQIETFEEGLRRRFGTGVHIRGQGRKGRIEIEYYSQSDLERILEILQE